jgi:uncharacterized protein
MKISREQFKKIKAFAKNHLSKNDSWHNLFHVEQTVRLSIFLAKKEKADVDKCAIIAWLHDIMKRAKQDGKDHAKEGAKRARIFLTKIGLDKEDVDDICYAIYVHNKGVKKKTKEAQIIYDADKLQAIGPYGILRAYGDSIARKNNQVRAYKEYQNEQKMYMNGISTKTAKRIAKEKFQFMKKFNKHYEDILHIDKK